MSCVVISFLLDVWVGILNLISFLLGVWVGILNLILFLLGVWVGFLNLIITIPDSSFLSLHAFSFILSYIY